MAHFLDQFAAVESNRRRNIRVLSWSMTAIFAVAIRSFYEQLRASSMLTLTTVTVVTMSLFMNVAVLLLLVATGLEQLFLPPFLPLDDNFGDAMADD